MDASVKFKTKNGCDIDVKTASMAVFQWYVQNQSKGSLVAVYGPYHESFVETILSALHNKFGKFCEYNLDFTNHNWYKEGLPENRFDQDVIFEEVIKNEKVLAYEDWCKKVLHFLERNKDIKDLEFDFV